MTVIVSFCGTVPSYRIDGHPLAVCLVDLASGLSNVSGVYDWPAAQIDH